MNVEILGINTNGRLPRILRLHSDWHFVLVATAEEAIEKMQVIDFDVVVAPEGQLDDTEVAKLKKFLALNNHDSIWITYGNDGEAMLEQEIVQFLNEVQASAPYAVSVTDEGLKKPAAALSVNRQGGPSLRKSGI